MAPPDLKDLAQVTVRGYTYRPEDTVYMNPENDGEAYFIGRIIRLAMDSSGVQTALIGWFYRTRDISMRRRGDARMLVATMHSDWNPVESIRGKCVVRHRAHVPDLEAYKMQDDSFYYEQLYDRFTQRSYDVVPIENVRTLPSEILASLRAFEFLVTDAGKGTDFTSKEVCSTCSAGAIPTDSVQCADCSRTFHMRCLEPPLTRKPGKGFAWTCVQCQAKKQMALAANGGLPSSEGSEPSPRPKKAPADTKVAPPKPVANRVVDRSKPKPMFPFRYVGDYARFREVLDGADDETVIYPRAASRIGRKYQADLPAMDGIRAIENVEELLPMANPVPSHAEPDLPAADAMDEDLSGGRVSPPNAVGAGEYRHRGRVPLWRKRLMMQEEIKEPAGNASDDRRNVDDELVFSLPDDPPNSDIQRFFDDCRKTFAGPNCIDFVDRSMVELHRAGYDVEEATVAVENLTTGDLDLADWTPEEMQLFEAGIAKSGHELYAISKDIPTKRRKDVVRFFYQWKKTPRYVPVYSQYCRKYRPSKKFKTADGDAAMKDAEQESQMPSNEQYCTNCWTTTGPITMASIRGQEKSMICGRCLEHWLRYAVNRHVSDSTRRSNRDDAGEGAEVSQPKKRKPKAAKQEEQRNRLPCSICGSIQGHGNAGVISCAQCSVRVHEECYGADVADDEHSWYCDRCRYTRENPSILLGPCVLCRNAFEKPPVEAFKRTIGGSWVHVVCSIWMPEVKFADAANLELADIAMVDRRRWAAACMLCNEERGACIACHFKTCNKTFHIACAKRANLPLLLEEGKSGKIHANLYCAEHRNSPADPTGAQKPELIPFYVEQYKQLPRQYSDYRGAALRSRAMGIVDRCECHFAPMPVVPTAAPASRKPAGKGTVSAVKPLMANNLTSAQEQSSVEIRGIEQQCGTIGALKHAFGIMDDMEIG